MRLCLEWRLLRLAFVRAGCALPEPVLFRAGAAMRCSASGMSEWRAGAAKVPAGFSAGTGVGARISGDGAPRFYRGGGKPSDFALLSHLSFQERLLEYV